ncbi:MAG: hypothetical protein RI967_168 [Planctomycetota bacterium]
MPVPPPAPDHRAPPSSRAWTIIGRVKGVALIATAVVMAAAAVFIASMLRKTLAEEGIEPTGAARLFFESPWIVGVLSIPAVAACWPLLKGTRRPILWMTVSSLLLLPPLALLLYGAVSPVAAIYEKALDL